MSLLPTNGGGPRRLLAVFAHPDDESFAVGGTLAHYARLGVHVTLVCATLGEAGEIAEPGLATPETLGQVRAQELRNAARVLGVAEVIVLGYRDSGMVGTEANRHSDAYVNAPPGEVVERLVGIIRQQRPHAVLTFEPDGIYGHPDHRAIHRHTQAAFHAAADPAQYPTRGAAWQPQRLLYAVVSESFIALWHDGLLAAGVPADELADFGKDFSGWPDDRLHVVMDVGPHIQTKVDALYCHRTQFGPDNYFRRLPDAAMRALLSTEQFVIGWPPPPPATRLNGLFAGT